MSEFSIFVTKLDGEDSDKKIIRYAKVFDPTLNFEPKIQRNLGAKPKFYDNLDIQFSVSHSLDFWACAFSHSACGLDLQFQKQGEFLPLAKRFFDKREYEYLAGQEKNAVKEKFYKIWTAKESVTKFFGKNIDKMPFDTFSVVNDKKFAFENLQHKFVPLLKDYQMCLTAEKIDSIKIILIKTNKKIF